MRHRFASIALELDLTPPQMGVLTSLDDSTSMSRLASVIGCDASNITWMTDRLEKRGLNERRGQARPADLEPARSALVRDRVVDGGAGVRVGVGGHIGDRPPSATAVGLPAGLRLVGAAAAPAAVPDRLALPRVVGVQAEG